MHILGLNCFAHDSAAAIIRDGEMLGLVEEERFLRKKHIGDFPTNSIRWCCETAGIEPAAVDHVVFYWDSSIGRWERVWHVLRHFPRSLSLVRRRWNTEMSMPLLRRMLHQECGIGSGTQVHVAPHHLCHAASSFLTSPFEEAAILTLDAIGEWESSWLGIGRGLDLHCLQTKRFPHSLGLVYGAFTQFLGHRFNSGEGKVMGMAPYGDPERFIAICRDLLKTTDDGMFAVDLSYFAYHVRGRPEWFSQKFFHHFGKPIDSANEPDQRAFDIAAAIQQRTEEVGLHMARWLQRQTGLKQLCLAGGVCLNSVMNGRLLQETDFDEVVVQPAANDAGTSLGGCYWLWNNQLRQPRSYVFEHAYFGPWFSDEEFQQAITTKLAAGAEGEFHGGASAADKVEWRRVDDAASEAATLIAAGKIVGWFQGRMEMGPRALGNRSILGDPRRQENKDIINARVKFREGYRPFAPSVLEEKTGEYFSTSYPSPYMILVYDVRPEKRAVIPAVTHVDGTGRVQSVSRKHNPRFHRLIAEFERLTGVAVVLNTSLNIRGKPIVNTPEDAIECFLTTGMDALFLGDFMLWKPTGTAAERFSSHQLTAIHEAARLADNAE